MANPEIWTAPPDAVRSRFLDYFKGRGHEIRPSAPLVPENDPTLLFIGAGMAPFKDHFLGRVPRTWRAAMEFRHDSWFDDEVYQALREHDIALVGVDEDEETTPLVPTASWGYLRLRKTEYGEDELRAWAGRVRAEPWQEAYVFLKHDEDSVAGPDAAVRLAGMVNEMSSR